MGGRDLLYKRSWRELPYRLCCFLRFVLDRLRALRWLGGFGRATRLLDRAGEAFSVVCNCLLDCPRGWPSTVAVGHWLPVFSPASLFLSGLFYVPEEGRSASR